MTAKINVPRLRSNSWQSRTLRLWTRWPDAAKPYRKIVRAAILKVIQAVPMRILNSLRRASRQPAPMGALSRWGIRWARHHRVDPKIESFELVDEPGVRMVNDGSYIAQQVYWLGRGGYEAVEVAYWEACCRESSAILELGANIGFFTVHGSLAAPPTASYVAVEPNPASIRSIERNLKLNGIGGVSLVERAVVGKGESQFVDLFLPDSETSSMHVGAYIAGGESIDRPARTSVSVAIIEAVELFASVDLVKIDIEGQEHHVLGAAFDSICENLPVVVVEVRRRTPKLRGLIQKLVIEHRWSVYALGMDGPHHVDESEILGVALQQVHRTRDVILIPPGRESLVCELRAAAGRMKRASHQSL